MPEIHTVQFNFGDYFRDTLHFPSFEYHGAYFLLIAAAYSNGGFLKNDDNYLRNIIKIGPRRWLKFKEIISPMFEITDEHWIQKRVVEEIDKINKIKEERSIAGRNGARIKKEKKQAIASDLLKQTASDPIPNTQDPLNHRSTTLGERKVHPLKNDGSKNPKKTKSKPKQATDEEWLDSLRQNPAYKHIDLTHELGKIDSWLSVNKHRKKTRRFIVNWLNKIDKPMEGSTNGHRAQQSGEGTPLRELYRQGRVKLGNFGRD